jgi:GDP-L-fucose synthase
MKFYYENKDYKNIPNGGDICKLSDFDLDYGFNHPIFDLDSHNDILWNFTAFNEFNTTFLIDNDVYFRKVFLEIKNKKNVRLIFSSVHEGKNLNGFLESLIKYKNEFGIDKKQIIIITINFVANNFSDFFTIITEPFLLYFISKNYSEVLSTINLSPSHGLCDTDDYINNSKKQFFLSYNKNCNRVHRAYFLLWLIKNNLNLDTKFSLLIKNEINLKNLYIHLKESKSENINDLWKYYDSFENMGEVILDWDYNNNPNDIYSNTGYSTKSHYTNTLFSVVTETTFENDSLNITEKSFKPLANCHPFIIIGDLHIHVKLKEFGFELYDDLIDYSFDSIYDNLERLDAVTKEIKRIYELGNDFILSWYKKNINKIKKNKEVLLEYSNKNVIKKSLNKIKMKKVLVTGCSGLVGVHLIKKSLEKGYEVVGVDINEKSIHLKDYDFKFYKLDLTKEENIKMLFEFESPDVVYNSFGIKGSPIKAKEYPVDFLYPSFKINTEIINQCNERNIWLIFVSSVGVYSPSEKFIEDDVWKSLPSEHDWYPSWSKRMGEILLEAYKIQHGYQKWAIIRPANIFGEYDDFSGNGTVISTMIKKVNDSENGVIEAWGDGSPVRDFVYAGDVADAIISLYEKNHHVTINFGSGVEISIKDLITLIIQISRKNIDIIWNNEKPNGDLKRLMDVTKQKEFDLLPKLGLEKALKLTYNHYINNID